MRLAAFALLLAGCTCEQEMELAVDAPETDAEAKMLAVRTLVQKLSNARDLSSWRRDVDGVAKKTGLSKSELRWRTADLVRMHRTCQAVATGDEARCEGLAQVSAEAADRCRSDTAFYGILCGRMIKRQACTGDDAERVARLAHKERSFVERACRAAGGESAACARDPLCDAWSKRAVYLQQAKVPTQHLTDEPIFAALGRGHPLSCDRVLVRAIDERLRGFVIPPPPLVSKQKKR